jgi:hypothetical protein
VHGSLWTFRNCENRMFTDTSWRVGVAKVPSSLPPARTVLEPTAWMHRWFSFPSPGSRRSTKDWFRKNDHWRWVTALSILSTWRGLGNIARWASWKHESENWHRKMPNFHLLVS